MAKTITLDDLQVLMGRMGEAYFFNICPVLSEVAGAEDLIDKADFEMPISDDGVNFEFGAPDVSSEKITEGRKWYTFAEDGEDNISMQVPSLHADLSKLFYTEKKTGLKVKAKGKMFKGAGYSTRAKKVKGAWLFFDKEHTCAVLLPRTDNYGNLVGATGDAKSYYNVAISTLEHKDYGNLVILTEDETADAETDASGE